MMTSREADLSSKDLNHILPSYLINEVQSIKSETEEKQSKMSNDLNIYNIPIFNEEKELKIETSFINSPNSYKSYECFNVSPKTNSNDVLKNSPSPISQNNQLDANAELKNMSNDANTNYSSNNIFNNNIFPFVNINKNVYNDSNLNNNALIYLNQNNYNNLLSNNILSNHIQNLNNIASYKNNQNYNNNNSFYLNQTIQQNQYNINYNFENNISNNNLLMQNINPFAYPDGNIINNNYFNNINNINIIHHNYTGNSNYINNIHNQINSFEIENYIKNQNDNFKPSMIYNKNLDDFINYINSLPIPLVSFLCTQKGTLEIKKKLEKSNNDHKVLLVNMLRKQGLSKIMKNTYGNYFFQQLIKNNDKSFISLIISYIAEDLIDISKDFQGTFCLQALLDEISSFEEEQIILNSIKNHEMEMALNKNATHVLQKIVLLFPDIHRLYLNEIILNNFITLSLDSNGICLIKIFIKTNTLLSNKKRINEKIINNFVILSESPFGNYGVQYLMEIWNENDLNDVKDKILENLYELSLQQFSSNVIEKAIEIFSEENREKVLKKLCFEENFIINLINNKFGKFVLNKAIKYMQTDMVNEFETLLNNDINNNIYKNKDKNKIKKLLMKIKNSKRKDIYFDNINKIYYNDENKNINKYNNDYNEE